MAKMHKLTKGGQTIFPATIYDAVVNPKTRKSLTTELTNLSKMGIYTVPFTRQEYQEGTGTDFEGSILKCLTILGTSRDKYVENESHSQFTTYYHTNDGSNNREDVVYANISGIGTGLYRSVAIFRDNDNSLIYEGRCRGECLFIVPSGHTIYLSAGSFNGSVPKWGVSLTDGVTKTKELIREEVTAYTNIIRKLPLSVIFPSGPGITVETAEYMTKISWDESAAKIATCYVRSSASLPLTISSNYWFEIYNTGSSDMVVGIGVTGGSADWSKGYIASKSVTIAAGGRYSSSFSEQDWADAGAVYGTNVYTHVVLKGKLDANALSSAGSLEVREFYTSDVIHAQTAKTSDTSDYSDISGYSERAADAKHADNAENATNAGWEIGGLAEDAVFRDLGPSGYIREAMTINPVDARTIRLTSNIDAETIGSRYRGVYWKITFSDMEELRGTWLLTSELGADKYPNRYLLPGIQDWGGYLDLALPADGEWNFYNLLMKWKAGHEDRWADTFGRGYFYVCLVVYNISGKIAPFDDLMALDRVPESTRVIASELSVTVRNEVREIVREETGKNQIGVTAWGDSLTAGAGGTITRHKERILSKLKELGYDVSSLEDAASVTYSKALQAFLGASYKVNNCGVGGESINTIAVRMGANVTFAKGDFVLPADTSPVRIGAYDGRLDSAWGTEVAPLLQGSDTTVNPCSVGGIECTLKWTGSSGSDTTGIYTIQRVAAGSRAVSFSARTPIIMSGSRLYKNTRLAVLWCWQNGGYSSDEELVEKLDKMIARLGTDKYVLIGLHTGTAASRAGQETVLAGRYGDRFINWREYVSRQALYDFGITPTTDADLTEEQKSKGVVPDTTAMAEGSLPMSFWSSYVGDENGKTGNDKIHMTGGAYAILAYKIMERFRELGYID